MRDRGFMRSRCPKYTIPDDVFSVLPYVSSMPNVVDLTEYMPISFLKSVKSAALGDILMYVAVVPMAISLLFQKDDFRLLKRGFLLIAISSILRPITFNVTRLSDPNPDSLANRYPFVALYSFPNPPPKGSFPLPSRSPTSSHS